MAWPPPIVASIVLLPISNVFVTFARYGHLKFTDRPLRLVVAASWGIAFVEYCFAVFAAFSVLYLGERVTLNHFVGFALICAGAFFVFKAPLPS